MITWTICVGKQCGIRHSYGNGNGKKQKSQDGTNNNIQNNDKGKNQLATDIREKLQGQPENGHALIELLLMECERAWAQSMQFKVQQEHSVEKTKISVMKPRESRHGMLKKLARALDYARMALDIVREHAALFSALDVVEIQCFTYLIQSFFMFEQKEFFLDCLKLFLMVQWLYSQLSLLAPSVPYRDFIGDRIQDLQPYLRYCSYQLASQEGRDPSAIKEHDFVLGHMQKLIDSLKSADPAVWSCVLQKYGQKESDKLPAKSGKAKKSSGHESFLKSVQALKSSLEKALPQGDLPKKKRRVKEQLHMMSLESELRPVPCKPILYDQAYYGIFDSLPADIETVSTTTASGVKQEQQQPEGTGLTNLLSSFFGR